ncbi:MAG: hypothetical protein AAGJ67_17125 [Pseudomonadota bacterium]
MMHKLTLTTLALLVLSGCNDGSGQSSSTPPSNQDESVQLTGRVADGYLSGATICLDINANMVCDANEPSTVSTRDGEFSLDVSDEIANQYPIIAIVTPDVYDLDTNDYVTDAYTLVSPPGKYDFISPITTLLALQAKDYSDESLATSARTLRMQLGVSDNVDLYADFIAAQSGSQDTASYEKVHNTAQLVARKLGQHLTTFNSGNQSGDIDQSELIVATHSVIDSISELASLAELEDFDADAIAQSKSTEWQNEVKDITPSERVEQIRSALAFNKALSGGVYQYQDIDGNITEHLTVKLDVDQANFDSQQTISVSHSNGDVFTFTAEDRTDLDLDFDGQVAFAKELPQGSLVDGRYTYSITNGDKSVVLFVDDYQVVTDLQLYPDALLSAGITWFEKPDDEALLSFLVEDDELYYQAQLFDIQETLLYTGRIEKGRNIAWVPSIARAESADTLLVKESDGVNHRDSNYIRELFKTRVSASATDEHIDFVRTYLRNTHYASDGEGKSRFTFQFNAIPAAIKQGDQLIQSIKSVVIEYFDPALGDYEKVLDVAVDESIFTELGKDAEPTVQNDYSLDYQLDSEDGFIFLDAFFQGDSANAEMKIGTYRYSVTNTDDETSYVYDYFGGERVDFPSLTSESFSVERLNENWLQLSIDSADGDDGSFVYEFQFNVRYWVDDELQDNFLFDLERSREPTALLRTQTLIDKVEQFERERDVNIEDILVDVSIFDSAKSYTIDNRFEVVDIEFDTQVVSSTP